MKLVQRILKDLGGTKIAKLFSMVHVFLTRLIYQRQTGDNFYLTRVQKRNLVNFLSEKFLELAQSKCHEKNCIVVTSGGFEVKRPTVLRQFGQVCITSLHPFMQNGIKQQPNQQLENKPIQSRKPYFIKQQPIIEICCIHKARICNNINRKLLLKM
jgi:hypothetical protein